MPNKTIEKLKTNFSGFLAERQSFLIALLLACLFWVSTKLSQSLQYTIPLTVNYILPDGKTFKSNAPKTLDVTFEGVGWNLFFLKSKAKTREVDIVLQNQTTQILGTEELKEGLANTFGSGNIVASNIFPSQLFLELETRSVKKIPVTLNKTFSLGQGFAIASDFKLVPDSITIDGPKSKIDVINNWTTEPIKFDKISNNVDQNIALTPNNDPLIQLSATEIQINLEIEKATEKIINVPIFIPPSFTDKIKLIPSNVELICQVGLSQYDRISASDFRIELPYYSLNRLKETPIAELKITIASDKASHLRLKPNSVEVFITE